MRDYLERYGRGVIEVDLDAVIQNVMSMKGNISKESKIIAVIKTDGYGHGSIAVAKALDALDCIYGYAVATEEEATQLLDAGVHKPVMILGYTFPYAYEEMAARGIETAVFREDMLKEMGEAALRVGKNMRVHIKVDTGMGRIGITPDEAGLRFVEQVAQTPGLTIAGIFTHFARADEADKSSAYEQYESFLHFTEQVEQKGITGFIRHCANSAAILEMPDTCLDAVRAGILLYGLRPSAEMNMDILSLKPALSFYSSIIYIKEMPEGCPISYGGTFVTPGPMRVATIPIGYGDGYPRSLSGKGYVLIHGKKAPILGRICMDLMMVDVTMIEEAVPGSLVTLIGRDGEQVISADELGELSGRFNYELICDLGKRIPRLYTGG